jgi:RNA polymerase sigma-70 factor (ECF subfamily)
LQPEDEDLQTVRAVQGGDRNAFRALLDRHGDAVYSVLLRLIGDADLAEELAQETFVRAYAALGAFRGDSRVRTWLIQIAVNLVRDRVRSEMRRPVIVSIDQREPSAIDSRDSLVDDPRTDPVRALEQEEIASRLERELARLPVEYREVFLLKHVEGLSYEAIARITGDSVGSLKVRAHRSRRLLRERLAAAPEAEVEDGRDRSAISRR